MEHDADQGYHRIDACELILHMNTHCLRSDDRFRFAKVIKRLEAAENEYEVAVSHHEAGSVRKTVVTAQVVQIIGRVARQHNHEHRLLAFVVTKESAGE